MDEMLSEAALPRAIELYCAVETNEGDRMDGLNTVIVQMHNGKIASLNDLVAGHLRPYLTSEEPFVRMRATKLLAQLLQRLPSMVLDTKVITALVKFFLDRFKGDYDSAGPCLQALLSLLELHENEMNNELVVLIAKSVLTDHHVPAMSQSLRSAVYHIIKMMMEREKYRDIVRGSIDGGTFVEMFADAMEGEKDPRCLLVCLRVAGMLFQEGGLTFSTQLVEKRVAERIFEVTSVYFPIVFRPPPNDPFNITAQDLWDALHSVFKSSAFMADEVLGMLMEKLNLNSSDVASTKIDCLKTLQVCLPAYGCSTFEGMADDFREVLLRLVVNPDQVQIADEAVATVGIIAKMLAQREELLKNVEQEDKMAMDETSVDPKESFPGKSWNAFVVSLISDCCLTIGQSIDSMVGRASGRLLQCIAQSSSLGFALVLKRALPIIEQWCRQQEASQTQRSASYELLAKLVDCIDTEVEYLPEQSPLKSQQVELIFSLLIDETGMDESGPGEVSIVSIGETRPRSASLAASAPRRLAIRTLQQLIVRPPSRLLSTERISACIQEWSSILVNDEITDKEEVHQACLEALVKTGSKYDDCANEISTITVPIVDQAEKLDVLADLCAIPKVFDVVMPHMLDKRHGNSSASATKIIAKIIHANQSYQQGLEKCCVPIVPKMMDGVNADEMVLVQRIAYNLISGVEMDRSVALIIKSIAQNVSETVESELVRFAIDQLLIPHHHDTKVITSVMPVITSIVGSAHPTTIQSLPDLENVVTTILDIALAASSSSSDETIAYDLDDDNNLATNAAQCVASILAKTKDDAMIDRVVDKLINTCDTKQRTFLVLMWVSKGLAMVGKSQVDKVTTTVLQYLEGQDKQLARMAANYFGTMIKPCDTVLNKESHVKEVLFFKQRFFGNHFNVVKEKFQETSDENYLLAALKLLEGVPIGILMQDVEKTLLFLLSAMRSTDVQIKTSALISIHAIIESNFHVVENFIVTLVPFLLELTVFQPKLRAKHRALAIDCLMAISQFPYNKIHTVRNKVTRSLSKALDDPKKPVRKRAVECRNKWLVLQNI